MSNVVALNSRRFLGAYCEAQNSKSIPEEVFFFTGVILTIVLPQIIYSAYGGLVILFMFAGVALAGTFLGVAMYYQLPYKLISFAKMGTVPQAPPSGSNTLKKAA